MEKERIALWDNAKLFLITLVVLGHFADFFTADSAVCRTIFIFIYAFHMPAFFFLSGLFANDKNVDKKCLFYLSGGVLLRISLIVFSRLFGNLTPSFPLLEEDGVPWFLYALAAYTLLGWLMRRISKGYLLAAALVLGCFAGYDASLGDTLCLSRIIVFAPFYFAGVWVDPDALYRLRQKYRWVVVPAALILIGWGAICYLKLDQVYGLRHLFTGRHPFTAAEAPYGMLIRLGCYALASLTGGAVLAVSPARRLPCLTYMGSNSLNVYFWHWLVYMTLEHFFRIKTLFTMGVWGKAAFLLLALVLTAALATMLLWDLLHGLAEKRKAPAAAKA